MNKILKHHVELCLNTWLKSKLITFMADKQNTEKWIRRITGVQIKQMVTLIKINPFF